jgi:predicted nucleotidyltransferase
MLNEKKEYLQKRYSISELGIFGSYARGEVNLKSDIDILVDFNSRIDGYEYIRLAHELEDTFNQKVDVVPRKGIKPQYLPYVDKCLIHV